MSDFACLSRAELEAMAACGDAVIECQHALAKGGDTIVGEALRGASRFYEWHHYPEGDVYDPATHAQFFYHAHPAGERASEHGHFHCFLREGGMPSAVRPLVMPELAIADAPAAPAVIPSAPQATVGEASDPWCHLVAISMDATGRAIRLFATNRWVTGETWYSAADVIGMLDRFVIGTPTPSPILNRWITAMFGLFRPEIAAVVAARDAAIMEWRRRRRGKVHVFEDRRLEIAAALDVDIEAQRRRLEAALKRVA